MTLGVRRLAQAARRQVRQEAYRPQRGDHVRIGPVAHPRHEWVGVFVRWNLGFDDFWVDTIAARSYDGKSRRVKVKREALRGPEVPT